MSLVVNTNIAAMNAYRNLSNTSNSISSSLQKLSSGFRINSAADDAAGLVNSENLKSQIGGLTVASRNAQDGISVAQTADGALGEVTSMLQRMRDLAVQKANSGGNSTAANTAIDAEYTQLATEIGRMGDATQFNGNKLFDGNYKGTFQIGANNGDTVSLDLSATGTKVFLGDSTTAGGPAGSIENSLGTAASITAVDAALTTVNAARGTLGAFQNRLTHTVSNLSVAVENLSASNSRIRDTDMAQEMTNFSKQQILQQAGTAMLAQANQSASGVMQLLRG